MKLFTIEKTGKLVPYEEKDFKIINKESDLETLLENNPQYFFDYSDILIIGRQVTTNLNSSIDLLGLDKNGNTIVIELKRSSEKVITSDYIVGEDDYKKSVIKSASLPKINEKEFLNSLDLSK